MGFFSVNIFLIQRQVCFQKRKEEIGKDSEKKGESCITRTSESQSGR